MDVREILHDLDNFYIASEICEGGELHARLTGRPFSEPDGAYIVK